MRISLSEIELPDKEFGPDIRALAEKIRETGQFSFITVIKNGDRYRVVHGEERLKAYYLLGYEFIDCLEKRTKEWIPKERKIKERILKGRRIIEWIPKERKIKERIPKERKIKERIPKERKIKEIKGVSEVEKCFQEDCGVLRRECKDIEEARRFLPELIKEAQVTFYKDYYIIPGLAEDILEEEF